MDVVIHRFGNHEFSPFTKSQYNAALSEQSILSSPAVGSVAQHTLPWIRDLSGFFQSGIVQSATLLISLLLLALRLFMERHTEEPQTSSSKASSIRWTYEISAQAARITAVVFIAIAFIQGHAHVADLVVLVYAMVLGLLRLYNNLSWRHIALHQINFVITAMLITLFVGQFLPCIQLTSHCTRSSSAIGAISALGAAFVIAITTPREWRPPHVPFAVVGVDLTQREPAYEETCSWFNYYCSYEWLTPILWKGTKGTLDMAGIPQIAWYDEPLYLLEKVVRARNIAHKTFQTTLRFQWQELSLMSFWVGMAYAFENISPFAMFKLLDYLANPTGAIYEPSLWLVLTFFGLLTRSLFFQQYVFTSTRLLVRIRAGMTQELYQKALQSMELEDDPFEDVAKKAEDAKKVAAGKPADAPMKSTSAGRLANLMAADIMAICRTRDLIMVLAGVPIGTAISLIGMYRMLGWVSLVGTAVLLIATPISYSLGKKMFGVQKVVRRAQDARISLVTEYLASIRAIKYFAWEPAITDKIVDSRAREQQQLWRMSVLQAIFNQVVQVFPFISLLVMFFFHVVVNKKRLDASTAFTTVFLINNIRRNIVQASAFFRSFAGAMVAFGRLDKYFDSTVPLEQYPVGPLRIENGCYRRNKKATFRLEDISVDFVEGGLNTVSGQSGSGKTTLLLAILGETYQEGGSLTRPNDIAFASQTAWLQNDTIEGNILFSSPMERARYDGIIEACCLHVDLKELSEGDQTVIGENGASLSGGQRARVALARALYSKAPLLLLDDIFSALDAKTAAGLWKYCFCGELLKGRTVVLVTQIPWIAEQSDLSIVLENGRIESLEPHIGVTRQPIIIAEVLGGNGDEGQGQNTAPEPELQPTSDALNDNSKTAVDRTKPDQNLNIVDQEAKASGKVDRLTFVDYMSYFGSPWFAILCIGTTVISNVGFFANNLWLGIWVEAYERHDHVNIAYYMGIYAFFTLLGVLGYGAIIITFEWGGWRAGRKLHNDFIHAIMRVPLSWFKETPIGRITNRFSADMASIDGALSSMLRLFLDAIANLLFRVAAVGSILPVFMLPAMVTCLVGACIGEMYTRTAVIVKRLTSSANSPVFSQFGDTLAGLTVIRARSGMSERFQVELADRLRVWSAASEVSFNCNRWLAIRIDFVTSIIATTAGIIAVSKAGHIAAGLVGFSLSNANSMSLTIMNLIRSMNDLEVEMQSFHRVREYVKLEPEEKDDEIFLEEGQYTDSDSHVVPKNWPSSGEIEFRNVTIRYDPDGADVLRNVNLKFRAGERVAVVGRTGSGKSTLVLSLLRFTNIVEGQILYDGVDITKVSRHRLREALTIIPQEAVLFSGSVESNLDPTGLVPRKKLERALENCKGIASFSSDSNSSPVTTNGNATPVNGNGSTAANGSIDTMTSTKPHKAQGISLSTQVEPHGENFSHGQRQVLSLCRALIRDSKLMLLDEATASMDYETDRGLQQVLRSELARSDSGASSTGTSHDDDEGRPHQRTLVTIAHRLRTIIDYDSVVVMSAGRVVEYGSPRELFDAKGQFHDMVLHSGEAEDLQAILENVPS